MRVRHLTTCISMRLIGFYCWLAVVLQGACAAKPNFVWIFADDYGFHDIGFRNNDVHTPTLDSMAKEGVKFTNQYVQAQCSPSRHAFLTGRYPYTSSMQTSVVFPLSPDCSGLEYKYLPQYLKELGYSTHAVGKWHLGYCRKECLPTNRGFDSFIGLYDGEGDYITHESANLYDWHKDDQVDYSAKGIHSEDLQMPAIYDVIDEAAEKEKPFFLYFAAQYPHSPLQPKDDDLKLYEDKPISDNLKKYYALISGLDRMVKNIKDRLEEKELIDNTYIIFLADNGADLNIGSNAPYRGCKSSLWEGATKSSSFISSPLLKKSGYENHGLIHITDWLPTIAKLAGGEIPASEGIDGVEQTDMILNGGESKRDILVYNIDREQQFDAPTNGEIAVRDSQYKLIWGFPGQTDGVGLEAKFLFELDKYINLYESLKSSDRKRRIKRGGRYGFSPKNTMIMDTIKNYMKTSDEDIAKGEGFMQLFDLKNDPTETTDIRASENPAHKEALKKLVSYVQNEIATRYKKYSNLNAKTFFFRIANVNGFFEPGWCESLLPLPE